MRNSWFVVRRRRISGTNFRPRRPNDPYEMRSTKFEAHLCEPRASCRGGFQPVGAVARPSLRGGGQSGRRGIADFSLRHQIHSQMREPVLGLLDVGQSQRSEVLHLPLQQSSLPRG